MMSCEMSRCSSPDMSIKSRDNTGQRWVEVVSALRMTDGDGMVCVKQLTVTWYSWERYIKMHGQLFSPAPVDDYRCVDANPPIVEEFNHRERQDDRNGDQCHYGPKVDVSTNYGT